MIGGEKHKHNLSVDLYIMLKKHYLEHNWETK